MRLQRLRGNSMPDSSLGFQLGEWKQVLNGTQTFLRVAASNNLPISSVMRLERRANRLAINLLASADLADPVPVLGTVPGGDLGAPEATDELISHALSESGGARQSASSAMLGTGAGALVDDGPEGVDNESYRLVSEETPSVEVDFEETELELEELEEIAIEVDEIEEIEEIEEIPEIEEVSDFEEFEEVAVMEEDPLDEDTAGPGTMTPPGIERHDSSMFDDEPTGIAAPLLSFDDETGEVTRPNAPSPLLSDFDFDDDSDEVDETMVFGTPISDEDDVAGFVEEEPTFPGVQAAIEEDEPESFDLMPDLAADDDIEPIDFDDSIDDDVDIEEFEEFEDEPAPAAIGVGASVRTGASVSTGPSVRPAGAAVATSGLYGNPNVPTIRDTKQEAPRAAAIQISAGGGPVVPQAASEPVNVFEEEEVLEIGAIEDYDEDYDEDEYEDDDDDSAGGGFRLNVNEYDEEEEYEEEEEEEEEPPPPAPPPPPQHIGPSAAEINQILVQAQEAADRGDMQAGIDLFGDAVDADPDSAIGHVGRGRLYLDLGDYTRAMSDFMVAEDIAPDSPEPQVAIGDLYFARKDYRKAIDYFNEALRMSPNHAMAFCRRGISHYYRKNYPDALEDLRKAESLDGDIPNISTYINMARKKAKKK